MPRLLSSAWIELFRQRLLDWYAEHRRDLPWRRSCDAYAIWISEIMLQQTQVATVVDYYARFMHRFPDVHSLAAAPEQEVLTYWAGLGYYRRAKQLHAAAQKVVHEYAGTFPTDLAAVQSLPGIGRYTAGAIVSFAYGERAPIVEANTQRLYSRLIGLRQDPRSSASQAQLWDFAERILPPAGTEVGLTNQAVMELGSLVCVPKQPACAACPLAELCTARQNGWQADIPPPSPPKSFTPLVHGLVVIHRRGQVLLRQNPSGQWWSGMWDFPRCDLTADTPRLPAAARGRSRSEIECAYALPEQRDRVHRALAQQLGLSCRTTTHLRTLTHAVTRYRITVHCYDAQLEKHPLPDPHAWQWVDLQTAPQLPLTSTAKRLRDWLLQRSC